MLHSGCYTCVRHPRCTRDLRTSSRLALSRLRPQLAALLLQLHRPIRRARMIVPFLGGGMTDAVAHAMQNELSKVLGQTVSIVNKSGASGTVGIIDLFRAPPDGYTIAITSNSP